MKRLFVIILSFLCAASLLSCKSRTRSAEQVLEEISLSLSLPAGELYFSGAEETSPSYLSPELAKTLYGKDSERYLALTEEYAIYLSGFAKPYEIAVFKCYSASDTDALAEMCLSRAELLSVLLRDTDAQSFVGNARIFSKGKYTVMVICDTPNAAEKAIKRALG